MNLFILKKKVQNKFSCFNDRGLLIKKLIGFSFSLKDIDMIIIKSFNCCNYNYCDINNLLNNIFLPGKNCYNWLER
jgi:hypothetical protein